MKKCYMVSEIRLNAASEQFTIRSSSRPPGLLGEVRSDTTNVWMTPLESVSDLVRLTIDSKAYALPPGFTVKLPGIYDESTGRMICPSAGSDAIVDMATRGWSAPCFKNSEFHQYACPGVATDVMPWHRPDAAPGCCQPCLQRLMADEPWKTNGRLPWVGGAT